MNIKQKITPFLCFDSTAEEAVNFYVSVFPNSRILDVARYGKAGPGPEGSVMCIAFELAGQAFAAINAGPLFKFTGAISLYVDCENQQEIDRLWETLGHGGEGHDCGWLTDRYGVTWQINSWELPEMMLDADPARVERAMRAMMQMKKINLAKMRKAYAG
ncbi:VOC family protein [Aquabacter sp. CN5-332]|uniref:VOC family protein n=1 Tax=Aquabacter sp. CN5-332 TaxID=3156608 RepID=UPI0032B40488